MSVSDVSRDGLHFIAIFRVKVLGTLQTPHWASYCLLFLPVAWYSVRKYPELGSNFERGYNGVTLVGTGITRLRVADLYLFLLCWAVVSALHRHKVSLQKLWDSGEFWCMPSHVCYGLNPGELSSGQRFLLYNPDTQRCLTFETIT